MCPKRSFAFNFSSVAKQSGVSLAILLFIIIIISLLAVALARLNSQSNMANAQQVIAARALFAAESGAQLQAARIFPVAGGAGLCANQVFNFAVSGINSCSASTTCSSVTINSVNYYQVTSQGVCASGTSVQASRTLEVRLKDIS